MRGPLRKRRRRPMRLHKIIFVFFISFISIYPLYARAQVPPPPEIPKGVTKEEARQFINEYRARFMKLNLDPFMELFSKKAVENRMIPYTDIREAYQKTIAGSRSIVYNLRIYSIQRYPQGVFVTGRYEIIQAFKKGGKKVLKGDIQWNLIQENGSLKIRGIDYGRSQ
jgi:sulfatase maturation enzyme AslB (radical SAM superfamily)